MNFNALKQQILQRAIQGKLVPQDSSDEPASVLLERIKSEQRIDAGKDYVDSYIFKGEDGRIYEKIGNKESNISDEVAFDLPVGWEYIRLSTVCTLKNIETSAGENLPYFDARTLRGRKKEIVVESGKIVNEGDRVILVDGENSGEVFVIPRRGYMGCTFRLLVPRRNFNMEFLDQILKFHQPRLKNNKTGSAIPHLNKKLFKSLVIGLPPLDEQKRIVYEVDRIFSLLDIIENDQKKLCISAAKIRANILDSAMQGKLGTQDPSDKPVGFLLKQIEEDRRKKTGNNYVDSFIYKGTNERFYEKTGESDSDISSDLPFDLPDGWVFVRLSSVCALESINSTSGEKLPYLDVQTLRGTKDITYLYKGKIVDEGDMVILVDGENSGEVFSIPCRGYMGSTFRHLSISSCINADFLNLCLKLHQNTFKKNKTGSAIPHLDKTLLYSTIIGLPPLEEQLRIVDIVNDIFSKLDVFANL